MRCPVTWKRSKAIAAEVEMPQPLAGPQRRRKLVQIISRQAQGLNGCCLFEHAAQAADARPSYLQEQARQKRSCKERCDCMKIPRELSPQSQDCLLASSKHTPPPDLFAEHIVALQVIGPPEIKAAHTIAQPGRRGKRGATPFFLDMAVDTKLASCKTKSLDVNPLN